MIWAMVLELNSEFIDFPSKVGKLLLNVSSLLVLKRKNLLLNRTKCLLTDFYEMSFTILKLNQEVFIHFDLMFLEKHDGLFHWLNLFESSIFNHFYVS